VVEGTPDRLVVERTFSLATDPYLAEARVLGRRVVPASIAWEALAAAAELLLGAPVTGARALNLAGPLLLDGSSRLSVRVEAERTGPAAAQTTLYVLADGGAPRVRLAGEFSTAPAPAIAVPRDVARALDRRGQSRNGHAIAASAETALHLGETVAGCVWARSLSFCELVGGIRAESEDLFPAHPSPRFVLSPAVLECAFMLAGFGWYALARQSGLPADIERIALGRPVEPGEEVHCHVRLRASTPDTITADLLLVGADRAGLTALHGCRLVRADRLVDARQADAGDAVSWAQFCRTLQEPTRGNR
jgi:hypothetical protein